LWELKLEMECRHHGSKSFELLTNVLIVLCPVDVALRLPFIIIVCSCMGMFQLWLLDGEQERYEWAICVWNCRLVYRTCVSFSSSVGHFDTLMNFVHVLMTYAWLEADWAEHGWWSAEVPRIRNLDPSPPDECTPYFSLSLRPRVVRFVSLHSLLWRDKKFAPTMVRL